MLPRKKEGMDRQTDRQMYRQTDGQKDQKYFLRRWHKSRFYESGTNVFFMKVALMSFFSYRWDKCRVLAIGGTYVYLIEGGTNVGGTNVGGRKVASSFEK